MSRPEYIKKQKRFQRPGNTVLPKPGFGEEWFRLLFFLLSLSQSVTSIRQNRGNVGQLLGVDCHNKHSTLSRGTCTRARVKPYFSIITQQMMAENRIQSLASAPYQSDFFHSVRRGVVTFGTEVIGYSSEIPRADPAVC